MFYMYSIGPRCFGKRDFHVDGSYTTTEWFAISIVPLVPLRTLRVRDSEENERFLIRKQYEILQMEKLNLKQVASVYLTFRTLTGQVS